MWAHPAFLIGAGIVGAVIAIVAVGAASYRSWEEQQQQRNRPYQNLDLEPAGPRIIVLGPCGYCEGEVTNINGYQSICNHYIHYTCAAAISREFQGIAFSWSDVCRSCLRARIDNNWRPQGNQGLRNRRPNIRTCADCRRKIIEGDESRALGCNQHKVHKTCWDTMQASDLTTCSMCMDEM